MKRFIFSTVVAAVATVAGQADGFRPQVSLDGVTEMLSDSVEGEIKGSRDHLAKLAHDDKLVLERFDQFISSLEKLQDEHVLSSADIKQVLAALDFAAVKHQHQTRKNKAQTPYISHPIGVANNLIQIGEVKDPEIIIAALLHDTVEDTKTSFAEIEKLFGKEVRSYVNEVTDDKSLSKVERKRLQVINASHKSAGAAQIKLADKLYNLTDLLNNPPEDWSRPRVDAYFEWAEAVINRLPAANAHLKQAADQLINQYWESQDKAKTKK